MLPDLSVPYWLGSRKAGMPHFLERRDNTVWSCGWAQNGLWFGLPRVLGSSDSIRLPDKFQRSVPNQLEHHQKMMLLNITFYHIVILQSLLTANCTNAYFYHDWLSVRKDQTNIYFFQVLVLTNHTDLDLGKLADPISLKAQTIPIDHVDDPEKILD